MSKTKKIRRLERKIESQEEHIDILKWSVSDLKKRINFNCPSIYHTPRPNIHSSDYQQEQLTKQVVEYIYKAMDKEYRKVYDNPAEWNVDPSRDCKFVIYMDERTFYILRNIGDFREFEIKSGKSYFRGYEIILVSNKSDYVHFVRVF